MKNIIIIAGLTGVGKSEIASYLQREYNAHFVVSISTRPMREGESEGNPYYFTDKDTFLSMVDSGEIFEHRSYDTLLGGNPDTWYYGCTLSEIKDNQLNVAVLDTVGAKEFYDKFGDRCTTIFVTAFKRIMEELIKQRGDFDKTEFNRRIYADMKKFDDQFLDEFVDYQILNRGKGLKELFLEVDGIMDYIKGDKK